MLKAASVHPPPSAWAWLHFCPILVSKLIASEIFIQILSFLIGWKSNKEPKFMTIKMCTFTSKNIAEWFHQKHLHLFFPSKSENHNNIFACSHGQNQAFRRQRHLLGKPKACPETAGSGDSRRARLYYMFKWDQESREMHSDKPSDTILCLLLTPPSPNPNFWQWEQ